MNRKVLYITPSVEISFNDDNWFKNNESHGKEDESENIKEVAISNARSEARRDVAKLLSHFKNVAVLTAAGTSMDNGVQGGKSRSGLWEFCKDDIDDIKSVLEHKGAFSEKFADEYNSQNIEHFLSLLLLYESISEPIQDGKGNALVGELEGKIAKACDLKLDDANHHHADFICKLTARKPSDPRLQLYTTNYDTLFEQAAQSRGFTIIDGFSFSYPRVFNGINFDRDIVYRDRTRITNEESFVPNVFQLFKIHGSVDWEQKDGKIYQTENRSNPCIIYPASNKYESSYEQPYFEMMSNFQKTLRKESTLLIVVGFGFADKHIQNVIKDAVAQNPNFHLLVVCYGKDDKGEDTGITNALVPDFYQECSELPSNVSVLFSTFKDFVELLPLNKSYSEDNQYETV